MKLFYGDKDICLRIRVSRENQERMKNYIPLSAKPLFEIKRGKSLNIRFEHKTFICTYEGKKQQFFYKDIQRAETVADGLILCLDGNRYISVATENTEKHNSELYDIVAFLKRNYHRILSETAEILYPDDEEGRYRSDKEPLAKISFALSEKEIRQLLWYDYLIDEKMLSVIISIVSGLLVAIILQNNWIAILAGFPILLALILTPTQLKDTDGFIRNHQGRLYALLFDDCLIIRLHNTDLELEYHTMKRLKNVMGLTRIKSGDFFVLTLPERIEQENSLFFQSLYRKIG